MKLFYVGAGPSPRLLVRSGDRPNHPVEARKLITRVGGRLLSKYILKYATSTVHFEWHPWKRFSSFQLMKNSVFHQFNE